MPETMYARRVSESEEAALKRDYFDRYWITREYQRTDRRTMERAHLVWSRLARRRGRALDIGCGRGLFASFLSDQGLTVDATDISPQAVEFTAQRGVNAWVMDLERETPEGQWDLVFCMEVLQQVRDPEDVLSRLSGVLRPEGELVLSLPNEFHVSRRFSILFGRPDLGDPADSHLKFFTPARARALARACGFEVREAVHTSIVPPRLGPLSALGRWASGVWPAGLSLSTLLFLRKATL